MGQFPCTYPASTASPLDPRCIPELLAREAASSGIRSNWVSGSAMGNLRYLLNMRKNFGISRVGSITGLDRIGLPVCQAVRPLALSNAVTQGKGLTAEAAALSAFMEAVETWAAETQPHTRAYEAPAAALGSHIVQLYESLARGREREGWSRFSLLWVDGWDFLSGSILPVPLALVDTVYTLPSPHPDIFPRTTSGLGAGFTFYDAVLHALLEVLERDVVAEAQERPNFFEDARVDPESVTSDKARGLVARFRAADILIGLWVASGQGDLPVYWCHVMDVRALPLVAPLPAEGFGCAFTHEEAVTKALLEAAQARLAVISGAREDLTRRIYRTSLDRKDLRTWRYYLAHPAGSRPIEDQPADPPSFGGPPVETVLSALRARDAQAVIAVPLLADPSASVHAVRIVAPPLKPHHGAR